MNKHGLKGYFSVSHKDNWEGVGIIAHNIKEAKRIGWQHWEKEDLWDMFTDHRVKLIKNAEIPDSITHPMIIDDGVEGVLLGLFSYAEECDCPICDGTGDIRKDEKTGKVGCESCLERIADSEG